MADGDLVVLTGAGGFVGQALAARLLAEGFRVRALVARGPTPAGVEAVRLPSPEESSEPFHRALEGAVHLVHAGGLNNADKRLGESAYHGPNAALTGRLAQAAAEGLAGRMVFLSSIRAARGAAESAVITDGLAAEPGDAYGRSKRAGETLAAEAYGANPERLAVLRLAPVYGRGMRGLLGGLLRLARTRWPLPLGALAQTRSLLSREAGVEAVLHALNAPALPPGPLVVSNTDALTIGAMVGAMRHGMGRPARLVAVPGPALRMGARAIGRAAVWDALNASQPCRPDGLQASGWQADGDTRGGLARVVRGG